MNPQEFYTTWPRAMAALKRELPDVGAAFHGFHQPLMAEGALTPQQKELIAIGISIAVRCESCIYAHIQQARKIGASRAEILDAARVAVMMQGGPGYVYVPKVIDALNALEASNIPQPVPLDR